MTAPEIENVLIKGISSIKNLTAAEIAPERSFHELGIDSLGFVEILVFIENTFKLELIASDLAKKDFESVRTLALFISRNLK
jgi:acyl carrier protein